MCENHSFNNYSKTSFRGNDFLQEWERAVDDIDRKRFSKKIYFYIIRDFFYNEYPMEFLIL